MVEVYVRHQKRLRNRAHLGHARAASEGEAGIAQESESPGVWLGQGDGGKLAAASDGVRRHGAMPVEDLAPAAVVLAARLDAAEQVSGGADEAVVGSLVVQRVRIAPAHIQDLRRRIGVGLAARTVGAYDDGRTRLDEVRHVSRPEGPEILFI